MTDQINDYFNLGLLFQAFHAERNILIWNYIGEDSSFLDTQDDLTKKMYSFVQEAAQTNFVLSLGKLYDKPDKIHPNRCILSFLNLLTSPELKAIPIVEDTNTIKLLKEFECPKNLIAAVNSDDKNDFPRLFSAYYIQKYNAPAFKRSIVLLKAMRNKVVAHNEVSDILSLDFNTTSTLLDFASEIISIFGMAYHSTIWKTEKYSFIKANAERNAYFVKAGISSLKLK